MATKYAFNALSGKFDLVSTISVLSGLPSLQSSRGSNCEGTSGTTGRKLSLTGIAGTGELVHVQGAFYTPIADYTKATSGTISVLTFLNKVYDNNYIEVCWWE